MTTSEPVLTAPELYINTPWPQLPPIDFQGIPGIGITPGQNLWATWYGGGAGEGPDNDVYVTTRDATTGQWAKPWMLVHHPHPNVRVYDPTMWTDPQGRLWLFWAQCMSFKINNSWDGRSGVWGIYCEKPDTNPYEWSAPRRFCDGVMMNKPTIDKKGRWLMPVSMWKCKPYHPDVNADRLGPHAVIYDPRTDSVTMNNPAEIDFPIFDEHHVIELSDGRWSSWCRTVNPNYLAAVSYSSDEGKTWTKGVDSSIPCPNSRFYMGVLDSGNWLLISHDLTKLVLGENKVYPPRTHLTAWISSDEGATWQGGLLLDERIKVSYPDGVQAKDGLIHIIYDRERYSSREILLTSFREEDVLSGNTNNIRRETVSTYVTA